jgi:hypothetical protein
VNLSVEAKSNLVPHFLQASSLVLLQEKMLELNLSKKVQIIYHGVTQLNDGSFLAWYYDEINFYAKIKNYKATK